MALAPRDTGLCESLNSLCKKVVRVLDEASRNRPVPLRIRPIIETTEHSTTIKYIQEPNWRYLVDQCWDHVKETQELQRAVEVLNSIEPVQEYARLMYHRGDNLPLTPEDMRTFMRDHIVREFLWNVVQTGEPSAWPTENFLALYPYWEQLLLTDSLPLRSISILGAFRGPDSPIELESGLTIRKASDADLSFLAETWGGSLEPNRIGRRCWLLEMEYSGRREEGINHDLGMEKLSRIMTVLRLIKKGDVYAEHIFTHPKGEFTRTSYSKLPAPQSASVYELRSGDDIARLREMWVFYNGVQLRGALDFTIRRFNYGYERWRVEDRITDHVFALEALYVPDSSTGEIGYKLRTRAAALLGKDKTVQERVSIRERFQGAYRVRSMLVHGEHNLRKLRKELAKLRLGSPEELADLVEEYLRDSLIHFLKDHKLLSPEYLDNVVLGHR